jgi:hypothetical protein
LKPLAGLNVLAMGSMAGRPLCRFLESLGATLRSGIPDSASVAAADFLIDDLGIEGLEGQGCTRQQIEAWNPALVHVSVTPFGSGNERSRWRGGELVASAMGGALRLTGEPDRAPVKEARDACTFHAEMAAAAGVMAAHVSRVSDAVSTWMSRSRRWHSAATSMACWCGNSIDANCIEWAVR